MLQGLDDSVKEIGGCNSKDELLVENQDFFGNQAEKKYPDDAMVQ